jgi:AraC-like DNA-binding protein
VSALARELLSRVAAMPPPDATADAAARLIKLRAGNLSIDDLARSHALSRHQFARRFAVSTGLPPKMFARVTRFQSLVNALLSTGISRWASVATDLGFYDQAHMINEFRTFSGLSPTVFFRPRGEIPAERVQVRGRPAEWLRP